MRESCCLPPLWFQLKYRGVGGQYVGNYVSTGVLDLVVDGCRVQRGDGPTGSPLCQVEYDISGVKI